MRRRVFGTAALLLGLAVFVAVLGYNLWSYCCGRCSAQTFVTLGPFGLGLLGVALVAGLLLAVLKVRRQGRMAQLRCRCGTWLVPEWLFCPDCGASRAQPRS